MVGGVWEFINEEGIFYREGEGFREEFRRVVMC